MKKGGKPAILAAVVLLLAGAAGTVWWMLSGRVIASAIRLTQSEGKVRVYQDDGQRVDPAENLMLYSGYDVSTGEVSYAWINLDEVKLAKMDQDSRIEIQKNGQDLEVLVSEGSLFFNITQPLAEDESLTIRTSSMMVGIRGTCGWVRVEDEKHMAVYILEGTVKCTVQDPDSGEEKNDSVTAGEMAWMALENGTCEIIKGTFTLADVPDFVEPELDETLTHQLEPELGGPVQDVNAAASGEYGDVTWSVSEDGVLTICGTGEIKDFPNGLAVAWHEREAPEFHTLVIEPGITRIGHAAFQNCTSLKNVEIPDTVTSLGRETFANCTELTRVTIPDHVTSIGVWAFQGCTSLTQVTLPAGLTEIGSGCFADCTSLERITIPGSVTVIETNAFLNCTALAEVTIEYGVTEVGMSAFHGCSSLTEITVPGSVETVGMQAFADCSALTDVTIEEGVSVIEGSCFYLCNSLTRLTLPRSLTKLSASFRSDMLADVYYAGTEEELEALRQNVSGSTTQNYVSFSNAVIHCNWNG